MQILVNKKAPQSSCPRLPGLAPQLHGLAHHLLILGPVCHLGNEETPCFWKNPPQTTTCVTSDAKHSTA